jgi:hypothetical protein
VAVPVRWGIVRTGGTTAVAREAAAASGGRR